jgi:membrane associated rhomboid family serine protease
MNYENYRPGAYRFLPDVVKNLLIINIIMYLATQFLLSQGLDLTDVLGLHYFGSEKFRVYQVVTYMFMHDPSGIMHIFFNMLALYMFGGAVENIWGGKKFLTYYMLTGFGAAIAHYAIVYYQLAPTIAIFNDYINNPDFDKMNALMNSATYSDRFGPEFHQILRDNDSQALAISVELVRDFKVDLLNTPVVIGASGAVYGVLLAYGMLFPNSILYLMFALPIKAKYAVIIFGVLELYLGIKAGDNVAHFAHLGGLITGIIIILFWRNKDRHRRRDFFDQS